MNKKEKLAAQKMLKFEKNSADRLDKQIEEYEKQLKDMNVMDDYDGGAANQLRMVIDDLRHLDRTTYSQGWYSSSKNPLMGKNRWKTTPKKKDEKTS